MKFPSNILVVWWLDKNNNYEFVLKKQMCIVGVRVIAF
jgi:hypothetical protein